MATIKIHYPWEKTPPGGSFFVPTLDPFGTKEEGIKAALVLRVKAKASFGLMDGKHGVLFTRWKTPSEEHPGTVLPHQS